MSVVQAPEAPAARAVNGEAIAASDGPLYDRFVQFRDIVTIGLGAHDEAARRETQAAGVSNARFEVADVQTGVPGGPYDLAFSRFGTMFFANPVVALRNVRRPSRLGHRHLRHAGSGRVTSCRGHARRSPDRAAPRPRRARQGRRRRPTR
jgi:hypothetical protein